MNTSMKASSRGPAGRLFNELTPMLSNEAIELELLGFRLGFSKAQL